MLSPDILHRIDAFRHNVSQTASFEEGELEARKEELTLSYAKRLRQARLDPFGALVKIGERRALLETKLKRKASLPSVAAIFVSHEVTADLSEIYTKLKTLDPKNPDYDLVGEQVVAYDATQGMSITTTMIQVAEGEVLKGADKNATEIGDIYRAWAIEKPSTSDEADVYQKLVSLSRTHAEILRRDNSGFQLVDYIAERYAGTEIIQEPVPPYMIREVMAVGSRFAADLYKLIYQLAQR